MGTSASPSKMMYQHYSNTCLKKTQKLKKQNKLFKTDYGLMQVGSITECSLWSILQYF